MLSCRVSSTILGKQPWKNAKTALQPKVNYTGEQNLLLQSKNLNFLIFQRSFVSISTIDIEPTRTLFFQIFPTRNFKAVLLFSYEVEKVHVCTQQRMPDSGLSATKLNPRKLFLAQRTSSSDAGLCKHGSALAWPNMPADAGPRAPMRRHQKTTGARESHRGDQKIKQSD